LRGDQLGGSDVACGFARDVIPAVQFGCANRHRTSPPAGTIFTMANTTPATAWRALREGNERFVAGKPQHPSQGIEHRASLAAAQTPNAVVFGCADSRVAAEIIFDQGLGDMLVVRTAGHVMGPAVLGSIELAVTVLNVPLIVVLGHDSCGAVKATLSALEDGVVPGGYVRDVVERVIPSILLGRRDGLTRVDEFEARHVSETAAQLRSRSIAVAERLHAGALAIAGVTYQLADGRVILRDYLGDIGEGSRPSPDGSKSGSPTVRKAVGPPTS
jgi:carbonic anhydrase